MTSHLSWSRRETLGGLGGLIGSTVLGRCDRLESASRPEPPSPLPTSTSTSEAISEMASETASEMASNQESRTDLPASITDVFQSQSNPDDVLTALMPAVVNVLQCDRCFLFIRDPQRRVNRITHGYSRDPRWPTLVQSSWSAESPDLNALDPLTASAYLSPDAHFIEDIISAEPGLLNLRLEQSFFGHRALVHAPIYNDDVFYGVLEPCVFEVPRVWTESDRQVTHGLQAILGDWVIRYLRQT